MLSSVVYNFHRNTPWQRKKSCYWLSLRDSSNRSMMTSQHDIAAYFMHDLNFNKIPDIQAWGKKKSPLTCNDPLCLIWFHVSIVLTGNRSEIWFRSVVQSSIKWVRIICISSQRSRRHHLKDNEHVYQLRRRHILLQNINQTPWRKILTPYNEHKAFEKCFVSQAHVQQELKIQ